MKNQKKNKKKIRISGLLLILLVIYIIVMTGYYLFTMPIKRIIVVGNDKVSEKEIIEIANINLNSSVFKVSSSSIRKRVEKIDLIHTAKIKKNYLGSITIIVEENKILFYNVLTSELQLSNNQTIKDAGSYLGYPVLVNYIPSEIMQKLTEGLTKIDEDIIAMISEIEYSPDEYNDIVVDNERFLLRMNDGNLVYINLVNVEKLNKYQTIFASVGTGGTLYLDSSSKNYIFDKDGEEEIVTEEEGLEDEH